MQVNWRIYNTILIFSVFAPLFVKIGSVPIRLAYVGILLFVVLQFFTSDRKYLMPVNIFIAYSSLFSYKILNSVLQEWDFIAVINELIKYVIILLLVAIFHSGKINLGKLTKLLYYYIIFIVLYHIGNGNYIYYKMIGEPKVLFGLVPLILQHTVGIKNTKFILSCIVLFASGEKKAIIAYMATYYQHKWIYFAFITGVIIIWYNFNLVTYYFNLSEQVFYALRTQDFTDIPLGAGRASFISRGLQYIFAAEQVFYSPLWGHGGGYSLVFMEEKAVRSSDIKSMHNVYFSFLLDYGFVGLGLYLCVLRSIWVNVRDSSVSKAIFKYGCFISFFVPQSFLINVVLLMPVLYSRKSV